MIHHVFANRSNAGDWLSARGIQQLLAPLPVQEHLCDEPFVPATLRALAAAGGDDLIVIGGGGLFLDYFTPFWEGFSAIADRVRFCLWGVGCCANQHTVGLPLALLDRIIAQSRLCVVRDELTRSLFPARALPPSIPCPSLVVVTNRPQFARHQVLHVDHYDVIGPDAFARVEQVVEDFAARTGRVRARTNNVIPPGDEAALQGVLARYGASDVVVSSRLHGCILGLASGCRVVAVAGDRKVESFMAAAGLGEWVCGPDAREELAALLDDVPRQSAPVEFLDRARDANRRISWLVQAEFARHEPAGLTRSP